MGSRRTEYSCGIDLGTENLGICFFSDEEIIGYRGSPFLLKRYQVGVEIIDYVAKSTDIYDAVIEVLDMIFEFENTREVRIEKQLPKHNADMIRIDGIIFGYLKSKCKNVEYISPNTRMSFMDSLMGRNPESQVEGLPVKKYKDSKIPGMKITKYFYPEYFNFIAKHAEEGKLDDLCDSLIYAIMETFHVHGTEMDHKKIKNAATLRYSRIS